MSASRKRSIRGGPAAPVGAGRLTTVCCAGPLAVAVGALGTVGGVLRDPWLSTVGAVVLLTGTVYVLWCRARRRGAGPQGCCPTAPAPPHDSDDSGPRRPLNG